MHKSILTAILVSFISIFIVHHSYAQSRSQRIDTSTMNGYKYSNMFNLPGKINTSGNGEVELFNAGFDGKIDTTSILGCNGINLKESFNSVIGGLTAAEITDQIKNYFTTGMAQYLLTQVYSSPAIAAIFDSLEAFGNARVSMSQQRCNATQARADGKKAVIKANAVDRCVKDGNTRDACLAGDGEILVFYIEEEVEEKSINGKEEANASLYDVLGEDFFEGNDLKFFIPDFKACAGLVKRCSFDPKKKSKGVNQEVVGEISKATTGAYASTFTYVAKLLDGIYGESTIDENIMLLNPSASTQPNIIIADMEERSFSNPFISNIQLDINSFAAPGDFNINNAVEGSNLPDNPGDDKDEYPGGFEILNRVAPVNFIKKANPNDPDTLHEEFVKFINCRSVKFGKNVADFFKKVDVNNQFVLKEDQIYSIDLSGVEGMDLTNGNTYADAMAAADNNDNNSSAITNDQALSLIGISSACVYNQNMSVNPADYFKLARMGAETSSAVIAALSDQVSFLSVEIVLRFIKNKLLETASSGVFKSSKPASCVKKDAQGNLTDTSDCEEGTRDTATTSSLRPLPPQVLTAINMVVESIDNKIATLKAVKKAERTFAQMMDRFYEEDERKLRFNFN